MGKIDYTIAINRNNECIWSKDPFGCNVHKGLFGTQHIYLHIEHEAWKVQIVLKADKKSDS